LVDTVGRGAAWLVVVILLLFSQLPLRELVGGGHILVNDFGQLINAAVFMFGLSFALRWDRHVRMDVFHRRFTARTRAWILRSVAPPELTTSDIYRGAPPFVVIQLLVLALIIGFPALVTWLPRTVG